jgi:hypothetical protein
MARTAVKVDRVKLVAAINEVEKNGPCLTRSRLYDRVTREYNSSVSDFSLEITPSIVMLRIKEFNLTVKTPIGQRGRQSGVKMTDEHKALLAAGRKNRVKGGRKAKFEKNPEIKAALNDLRDKTSSSQWGAPYLPLVEKIAAGSMKAAVRLNCLQCSNFARNEIKECNCTSCPLFAFRPYQNSVDEAEPEEIVVSEEIKVDEAA